MTPYRNTILRASVVAALALPARAGNWANVQPAYNLNAEHAIMRLEAGADLSDHTKFYGFLDLDGSKEHPLDLQNFYGEARVMRKLGKSNWAAACEFDVGSDLDDFVRIGATYTPKTGKGNFTQLRLWPLETSGDRGPQLSVFSSQDLTDRVSVNGLLDYNVEPNTAYIEAGIEAKVGRKASIFAQARGFGEIGGAMQISPFVGWKWRF